MNALVFGEILWDIIEGEHHLGGAPLNFAAHVRKCGQASCIISCLGKDELGDKALQMVKELDVDISMIQRSEVRTGFVPVTLKDGQPEYVITKDVAYDYIDLKLLDYEKIASYDFFYFGSLIQRSKISQVALNDILDKHTFEHVFYDVNLRKDCYSLPIIENSLQHCTILKLNEEEVAVLGQMLFGSKKSFEKFCPEIRTRYPQINLIISTAGKSGSNLFYESEATHFPTKPIQVIDTVGAGDAFSAAFATVYTHTGDPHRAVKIANQVGGYVAGSRGPIPQYSEKLQEMIKG